MAEGFEAALPGPIREHARRARQLVTGLPGGQGTLFEELGFSYVGPIDGHDMDQLLPVLRRRTRPRDGAGSDPRLHREGQGLPPGRNLRRQVSRRGEDSTSSPGRRRNRSRTRRPTHRSSARR